MGFAGVRVSFLLEDMTDLGRDHPPALAALRERRDRARRQVEDAVRDRKARIDAFMDFFALNRALEDKEAGLRLYDEVIRPTGDANLIHTVRSLLRDDLLEHRRYEELAEGKDLIAGTDEALKEARPGLLTRLRMLGRSREQRERLDRAYRRIAIYRAAENYQILLGLGRHQEAETVAARILKFSDEAETYNALAWNGYMTGRPVEANLQQARKAFELSQGNEVHIIDTLARVLHALGRQQEAVEVVREAMTRLSDPLEQPMLRRCLADVAPPEAVAETSPASDRSHLRRPALAALAVLLLMSVLAAFRRYVRRAAACPSANRPEDSSVRAAADRDQ